jgi:hypothetical protein
LSLALIIQFLGELDRIKKMSGSLNEQTIRPAFRNMLRNWAISEELFLLEEHEFETKLKTKVYPDGTIVHDLRVPLGNRDTTLRLFENPHNLCVAKSSILHCKTSSNICQENSTHKHH